MTDFRNKCFNPLIIAILWITMHWPIRTFATPEQFNAIQTIAWGPQPVQATLKMGTTELKTISTQISKEHPLSAYTQWEQEPGGILRLVTHHATITSTPIPLEITLPKHWNGALLLIGGEHRLRGTDLLLSNVHIQSTGNLDAECTGQVDQLTVDIAGRIRWKSQGLKAHKVIWKSTGEGHASLQAQEHLTAQLVGSFLFEYDAPLRSVHSISQTGQSKIVALPPSASTPTTP